MSRPLRLGLLSVLAFGSASRGEVADLNHPAQFHPRYATKEAWEKRATELQEQVLVAAGLWPMPAKGELKPVIHGRIERDEYTVEKVYFESLPGFYVTGNLYRPKSAGPHPAVLSPHGHWPNGRFLKAENPQKQIDIGAEQTIEGATYPLQARCATLARMGCVVFHYDMVGYADSQQIPHREGFTDVEAQLRLQSTLGLQLWDSIRAMDFLTSRPDVDPKRVAVTGASGGATQTLLLGVVDPRPVAFFPAVMISENMQGGCVCENAPLLRVGTNNAELAATLAPRPLGMSAADDWTKDLETRGYPEIRSIYKLYEAEGDVVAKHFAFEHNYNQVSREMMYDFMNRHLGLGQAGPVRERPFVPVPVEELSVFDSSHPRPAGGDATAVRAWMTAESDRQLAELRKDPAEYRRVIGTALRVMVHDEEPWGEEVSAKRKGIAYPAGEWNGDIIIWAGPESGDLKQLSKAGYAVLAAGAGDGPTPDPKYAGFTFGYNRTTLAERVHDLRAAAVAARKAYGVRYVYLVAVGKLGPAGGVARALAGTTVNRAVVELGGFDFAQVTDAADENFLPGAVKYGGVEGIAAACDGTTVIRGKAAAGDVARAVVSPTIREP